MSAFHRWRLGRDPDGELRRVRRRYWATPQRPERVFKPRRSSRRLTVPVVGAVAAATVYVGLISDVPSFPAIALNYVTSYLAYFPN